MSDKPTKLGDLLAGQESAGLKNQSNYQQLVRDLMERKVHWLIRALCGLIALVGAVFCVSLLVEIFETMNNEVAAIIKLYMAFLFISVLFYSGLAAEIAVRGKIRLGSVPAAIFGALVLAGFFLSLWFFLTFILPKLVELATNEAKDPFTGNLWIIALVCMLLIIAFFGVISAGITFIIHLLYSHFNSQRQKLLEIELALAELSEKVRS